VLWSGRVLYLVVRDHLETFRAEAAGLVQVRGSSGVPRRRCRML